MKTTREKKYYTEQAQALIFFIREVCKNFKIGNNLTYGEPIREEDEYGYVKQHLNAMVIHYYCKETNKNEEIMTKNIHIYKKNDIYYILAYPLFKHRMKGMDKLYEQIGLEQIQKVVIHNNYGMENVIPLPLFKQVDQKEEKEEQTENLTISKIDLKKMMGYNIDFGSFSTTKLALTFEISRLKSKAEGLQKTISDKETELKNADESVDNSLEELERLTKKNNL